MLVSARYDAATPYRNAQAAEQRLGNAMLLTRDGWGHPSYQIPRERIHQATRVRYLLNLVAPRGSTFGGPDEVSFSSASAQLVGDDET